MNRKLLLLVTLLTSLMSYSQMGINTRTPSVTLDVKAIVPTGSGAPATIKDGLLIPRVDRLRAQTMTPPDESTMIYVNDVTTGTQAGKAMYIATTGFYTFDTTLVAWVRLITLASETHGFLNKTDDKNVYGYSMGSGGSEAGSQMFPGYTFKIPANALKKDGSYINVNFRSFRASGAGVWHVSLRTSTDGVTWSTSNVFRWQDGSPYIMGRQGRIFLNDGKLTWSATNGEAMSIPVTNTAPIYFGFFAGTDDPSTTTTMDFLRVDLID